MSLQVVVLAGRDKGKVGIVKEVVHDKVRPLVVIDGVNLQRRPMPKVCLPDGLAPFREPDSYTSAPITLDHVIQLMSLDRIALAAGSGGQESRGEVHLDGEGNALL